MTVGIGVIGTGVMGLDHARTLATKISGAALVAVADADSERAEVAARETGAAHSFTDAAALIAHKDVDAILIASPDATHPWLVLACLRAGKPVLCEKPLAPTTAECLKVIEAEQRLGKRLIQIGFMRRFDPAYCELKDALGARDVGRPLLMHCAHRNPSVPSFFTPDMAVTNSAVHEFDIIRWLLTDEIARVTVLSAGSGEPDSNFDPLMILVRTRANVLVDVEVFVNAGYGYDIRTEVVCQRGTLTLAQPPSVAIQRKGRRLEGIAADWRERFAEAYRRELQSWVNAIHTGAAFQGATAWDGYASTAVAEAALRARADGGTVNVEGLARPAFYAPSTAY